MPSKNETNQRQDLLILYMQQFEIFYLNYELFINAAKTGFKGAMKLYCMHYLCVIIVLFTTDLYKSGFSTCSLKKLGFFLCVLCLLSVLFWTRNPLYKFLITFSQKETRGGVLYSAKLQILFVVYLGQPVGLFNPSSKNQKNPSRKKFLIFQEMELSSSNIKTILIFSRKKVFFIFPEIGSCTFQPKLENKKIHLEKIFLYFRKRKP